MKKDDWGILNRRIKREVFFCVTGCYYPHISSLCHSCFTRSFWQKTSHHKKKYWKFGCNITYNLSRWPSPGIIWPLLTSLNGIFNKYEMIFQKGMDPSRSSFLMSFGRGRSTQIQRIPPPNRSLTLAVMGWMETETEWPIQTLRKISFIQWQLI